MKLVWTNEQCGIYTNDGKQLLKAPDIKRFQIAEGCEKTDEHAFDDCKSLKCLYIPVSFSEEEVDRTLDIMPEGVNNVCAWDRPYVDEVYDVNEYWYDEEEVTIDEFGVEYTNEGRRLLTATRPSLIGKEYHVMGC